MGIEVKNEIGKTTPLQDLNLKMINEAGGIGIVARCVEDVKKVNKYKIKYDIENPDEYIKEQQFIEDCVKRLEATRGNTNDKIGQSNSSI